MSVIIKPAGIDATALTANQVSLTATYTEKVKRPRYCNSTKPFQTSVTYTTGDTVFNGTSVFVPVIVTISAIYLLKDGSTSTRNFVEVFDVAFQGQTEGPSSITVSSLGKNTNITTNGCNGVTTLVIDDSLTVLIA